MAKLWNERGKLVSQRIFLPQGPLHAATGRRLCAIGHKLSDLYQSRRPAVLAARLGR